MASDDHSRPSTPDRVSRSSFSSIREHDNILPQSFTQSKISSYFEEAIDYSTAVTTSPPLTPGSSSTTSDRALNMIQTRFQPPVTNPSSRLLGYWTPADSFQGWKGIQVKGKLASKSFGDLQVLNQVFSHPPSRPTKRGQNRPGDAIIERLPTEILSTSAPFLYVPTPVDSPLINNPVRCHYQSPRSRCAPQWPHETQYRSDVVAADV